jgi:hypothetical protein
MGEARPPLPRNDSSSGEQRSNHGHFASSGKVYANGLAAQFVAHKSAT